MRAVSATPASVSSAPAHRPELEDQIRQAGTLTEVLRLRGRGEPRRDAHPSLPRKRAAAHDHFRRALRPRFGCCRRVAAAGPRARADGRDHAADVRRVFPHVRGHPARGRNSGAHLSAISRGPHFGVRGEASEHLAQRRGAVPDHIPPGGGVGAIAAAARADARRGLKCAADHKHGTRAGCEAGRVATRRAPDASGARRRHRFPAIHLGIDGRSERRHADAREPAREHPFDCVRGRSAAGGCSGELAPALSRHGTDRRVVRAAGFRYSGGGDVAARVSEPAGALALGDSPASRND